MVEGNAEPSRTPRMSGITPQEKKSLTHSGFWIPDADRNVYQRALSALNAAGIPYVVAGAYAIYEHTGIYRETKDLDLFVEPAYVVATMAALRNAAFTTRLEQPHWLAKAIHGKPFVDVIFGMGNGLALIDRGWYEHSRPAILAATPVRVAPPEELLWHRLFIGERHRQDMADIVHLIVCVGSAMNWRRLVDKTGEHWPLLLAQLQIFHYVYPEFVGAVPAWVLGELLSRARDDASRPRTAEKITRGTMISRFSFAIDVNEWGFRDLRAQYVREMEALPIVREIAASDVWDERSKMTRQFEEHRG
jgi:hypothetical protein